MTISDDLIGQYWRQANQRDDSWMPPIQVRFARAIERACTKPLLERITELEQQVKKNTIATDASSIACLTMNSTKLVNRNPDKGGCYPGCYYYGDSCFRKDCVQK